MRKALLYRLFKIGRIPGKIRPLLESEGIRICDEGVRGWVFTRKFRAPGKRYRYRKTWFAGFLAITGKRIIAYTFWKPIINIGIDDSRMSEIEIDLKTPEKLVFTFESNLFHPDMQGQIEVGFNTPEAGEFYRLIRSFQQGS